MRIRMLVAQAGPHISRRPGKEYDLPDVAEARRLVESEQAEALEPWPAEEVAAAEPEEPESEPETNETPSAEDEPEAPSEEPETKPTPKRGKKK